MTVKPEKPLKALDDYFNQKDSSPYTLGGLILVGPPHLITNICTMSVYTLGVIAERGERGDYPDWPEMEYHSMIARQMVNRLYD